MNRVLIIDDEESVRKPIRILLEKHGYSVDEADNGEVALGLLRHRPVDVVIADVVMPKMGGLETIMVIHHEFPDIALIVMSGKIAMDSDSVKILTSQFGADHLLTKPFTKKKLLEAVSGALST